jgi:hypothetical protein
VGAEAKIAAAIRGIPSHPVWLDTAIILIGSALALVAFILWFDNAQTITSNGVFKALTVRSWMESPATARLDPSNYLYYPAMAVLCWLLDTLGVMRGDPRHQISIINAFFAAICLCIFYRLTLYLTGRRMVAWAAAAFHLAGAFFLNLAISNEDILPSYTVMLGAMALAVVWFAAPTWNRVTALSLLFTFAWLLEWRLMFPALPALLLVLVLAPGTILQRAGRILLFLGVMIGAAKLAILLWGPHTGNVGPVVDLLWTGKGVYTGWAGFNANKLVFLWVGMSEYLLGGGNLGDLNFLSPLIPEMLVSSGIIVAIGAFALLATFSARTSSRIRRACIVFGVTFIVGQAMNLYSQPQDPQMQLNVMIWLTVAWALVLAWLAKVRPRTAVVIAIALPIALVSYNIYRVMPLRGAESSWRQALMTIGKEAPPDRTVFLFHGFEQLVAEMFYEWRGDWNYLPSLKPAPTNDPKAKFLVLVNGFVHRPTDTGAQMATALGTEIERVMGLGYDVVTNNVWPLSEAQFIQSMSTVTDAGKASAVYRMLHDSFIGVPAFEDVTTGPYYRLQKRSERQHR